MSAPVAELTTKQATALWSKLRQHFINAAAVIEEIIEKRAWEPLGYNSFAEAYHAQMEGVTLAVEVRPHVVYQMLTEGYDYDAIAESIKGVSRRGAESFDRQRRNGVPAKDAFAGCRGDSSKTTVRQHQRKHPSAAGTIHVSVGPIALKRYQAIAERMETTIEQIAMQAIADRFQELSNAKM